MGLILYLLRAAAALALLMRSFAPGAPLRSPFLVVVLLYPTSTAPSF
jgi:hypothetical protein